MEFISSLQRQAQNRSLGVGLALFIALYLIATICFIILA